jgi:hypothetical protein
MLFRRLRTNRGVLIGAALRELLASAGLGIPFAPGKSTDDASGA